MTSSPTSSRRWDEEDIQPARKGRVVVLLAALALATPAFADQAETVVVTGSRLPGGAIDPAKLPGAFTALDVSALSQDRQSDVLPNLVTGEMPGVSVNDEQGSAFQPDLVYRGFKASPISGAAEGLAVYQNGTRINEAFGDAVNWDLVPQFAVDRFTLQSGNPVFGLNALGGAIALDMKDGFGFQGAAAQLSAGSFGNVTGDAEYGARDGAWGFYAGVGGTRDDGFREHSGTALRQGYADVGYEQGPAALHLSAALADNVIDAVGPAPVELLARDRRAAFTYPQSIANRMEMAQLRGSYTAREFLFSGSFYYRHFAQRLIDGNTTDVAVCGNDPAQFCLEGNGDFPGDALYDANGDAVRVSALPAGATPGEIDFSRTGTDGFGGSFEASSKADVLGHGNDFATGATYDRGATRYGARGELGALQPSLKVVSAGVIIDQAYNPAAAPPLEQPVGIDATDVYAGLYAVDAFDLTGRVTLTLSGRLNSAQVRLSDRLGTSLNGSHDFTRFNPGLGATYKLSGSGTLYIGYSETNRAPTPGEISCADPASPCLLDTFLVDDPPLKQVVARTFEAGYRGALGAFAWSLGIYRTGVADDILLLATDVNGFGYFTNAGRTRHQGLDASLGWHDEHWRTRIAYSYLDATFRDALVLSSNSPAADANGLIFVAPGDRLPLMPRHRLTLSADYSRPAWSAGADLRWQGAQFLAGDESNQAGPLRGYATLDLHGAWRIGATLELFGEIENALDRHYATYGAFTGLDGLPPAFTLSDPRTVSPAPGRTVFAGARVTL
ncbi:MAG: TonB-dependent receptor [Rhizomicrobium sp.]